MRRECYLVYGLRTHKPIGSLLAEYSWEDHTSSAQQKSQATLYMRCGPIRFVRLATWAPMLTHGTRSGGRPERDDDTRFHRAGESFAAELERPIRSGYEECPGNIRGRARGSGASGATYAGRMESDWQVS